MSNKTPIRVAVTGAAGAIGYSLLFRLASGEVFGADQPVIVHLVDIEASVPKLQGVVMELEDCAFPTFKGVVATANLDEGFKDINWAILVGAFPRQKGMERKDLLAKNGEIFVSQGKALQKNAASDVRILVVGNPCNTNCLIGMNASPEIPRDRWFAMTRLDENRAKAQLAKKAGVGSCCVTHLAVWGNHSPTMYPDFYNAKICGKPVTEVIKDENWLKTDFVTTVAQRGTAVLNARGMSSAASAANAAIDTVKAALAPTPAGDCTSVSVCSDGSYGIPKDIICSFPVRSTGQKFEIIKGLPVNDFSRSKIDNTVKELMDERAMAAELGFLPKI